MTIIYILAAILYTISCIGNYKLVSREPTVVQAYAESPNVVFVILVVGAILWPLAELITFSIAGVKK